MLIVWWRAKCLSLAIFVVVIVRVGFSFPLFALKKRWRNQKTNAKWNSCIPLCVAKMESQLV